MVFSVRWYPMLEARYHVIRGGRSLATIRERAGNNQNDGSATWDFTLQPGDDEWLSEAEDHLARAISADPSYAQAYFLLGQASMMADRPEQSVDSLEAYIQRKPDNPLGYIHLGFAYEALCQTKVLTGETEKDRALNAIAPEAGCTDPFYNELIRAAWQSGRVPFDDLLEAGMEAERLNRYEQAAIWYWRAVSVAPPWRDSYYFLGNAWENLGQESRAIQAFEHGTKIESGLKVGLADLYYRLGHLSIKDGAREEAIDYFDRALAADDYKIDFQKVLTLDALASIYISDKQFVRAIHFLEQAVSIDPEYHWLHLRLGEAYYGCCADFERSVNSIQRAIDLNPDNKWAYLRMGDIYLTENAVHQARENYELALRIDPNWELAIDRISALQDN